VAINLFDLPRPFFPNPGFAWTSVGLLLAATGTAAYTDTKWAKVPNPLVVAILAVGLLLNVVRGAWQAAVGHPSWLFGTTDNLWLGGLDGFLFGLSGFLIGFGVFFLVWILGQMGGGDVKLFAALGGWVGFLHLAFLWVMSIATLLVWTIGKVLTGGLRPGKVRANIKQLQQAKSVAREAATKPGGTKKMRMTYALPVAVAALILSLWSHRVELLLAPPKPVPPPDTTGANPDDSPSPDSSK
jgi:prepilin peptidase CpaA